MRMEFSRLSGLFVSQRPWPASGKSAAELLAEAKDALARFYDSDEYAIWPKREFSSNPPELVQIIDADGVVLVEYGLGDFLADCGRCLTPGDPFKATAGPSRAGQEPQP